MRNSIIFIFIFISACNNSVEETKATSKDCSCVDRIKSVNAFFGTQINIDKEKKKIYFNCADIESAIASVTDERGQEICKNIYDIGCVSNEVYSFKLSDTFIYSSQELKYMEITFPQTRELFFKEVSNHHDRFFEFWLNESGDIVSIEKLDLQ